LLCESGGCPDVKRDVAREQMLKMIDQTVGLDTIGEVKAHLKR
jgi:hypothetical protein